MVKHYIFTIKYKDNTTFKSRHLLELITNTRNKYEDDDVINNRLSINVIRSILNNVNVKYETYNKLYNIESIDKIEIEEYFKEELKRRNKNYIKFLENGRKEFIMLEDGKKERFITKRQINIIINKIYNEFKEEGKI